MLITHISQFNFWFCYVVKFEFIVLRITLIDFFYQFSKQESKPIIFPIKLIVFSIWVFILEFYLIIFIFQLLIFLFYDN